MTFTQARRAVAVGAALAALAFGASGLAHHLHRHQLKAGDRLVPFAVQSLAGSGVTLAPTGHAQIINIFATWCPPCREETPAFAALAGQLKSRGIEVIGIDQQESAAQVGRFAQNFGLPYPVYIDSGTVTHDLLGARVIPTTIIINSSGVIVWEHAGPLTPHDLLAAISQTESNG